MKKLNLLCKSIFASLILLSCSSDDSSDNDDSSSSNEDQTITIEDTSFNVDKGIFAELGNITGFDSHYNAEVYISNGQIISYSEDGKTYSEFNEDSEIVFSTDLYAKGIEGFTFGTFEIVDFIGDFDEFEDKSIGIETYIDIIDTNGDEITYDAKSGTVTITDNGDRNYTLTTNAVYLKSYFDENDDFVTDDSNEITISFSFTGNFTYSNQLD